MDNNNSGRPRKKVTKQVLRRRQLTALAFIALVVLIFIIFIAKACTDKSTKPEKESKVSTTSATTTTTTTEPVTEPPTTTTTAPPTPTVDPELSAQVQLSTRELSLNVGESEMPIIYGYPEGCSEANEIWTSSDTNIATVDNMGNVTAMNAGECYIILKFDNNPAIEVQIKITVAGSDTPETPEPSTDAQLGVIPNNDADNNPNAQDSQSYQDTQGYQDTQNYQENQSDEQSQSENSTDGVSEDGIQNQ